MGNQRGFASGLRRLAILFCIGLGMAASQPVSAGQSLHLAGIVTDAPLRTQVTVRTTTGKVLGTVLTNNASRYAIDVQAPDGTTALRLEVISFRTNGQGPQGVLSALYSLSDNLSAANVTLLTTLVTYAAQARRDDPLVARAAVLARMKRIGMLLNSAHWSVTNTPSVDFDQLRAHVAERGLKHWLDTMIADLSDDELEAANMAGFPQAHGGIAALSLGDHMASIGFPGNVIAERVQAISILSPRPAYIYSLVAAPEFVSVNAEGLMKLEVPNDQPAGAILIEVSAKHPETHRGRVLRTQLQVLPTTVVAAGTVNSGGGRIESPWKDVALIVPPNAVTGLASFEVLRGELPSGQYAYSTRTTSELHAPTRLITPDPALREVELAQNPAATAAMALRSPRAQQSDFRRPTSREGGGHWVQWRTWDADLLRVQSPSGAHINRLRNDLALIGEPPLPDTLNLVSERVVSELFSYCGSEAGYASRCAGRDPVLFIHGFIRPGFTSDLPLDLLHIGGIPPLGGGPDYWGDFPERVHGNGFAVFEFNWMTAAGFRDVAYDLHEAIQVIQNRSGRKVHLIGHSFGGLLARTYLQGLATTPSGGTLRYGQDVASLTTLGTPHSGIFDTNTPAANPVYPKGQDSFYEAFEACGQLSCNDAGEPTPDALTESLFTPGGLNLRPYFNASEEGGDLIAALAQRAASNSFKVPVSTQVLIGLTARVNDQNRSATVHAGDGLIAYAGQRFHPALTCSSGNCANRSVESTAGALQSYEAPNTELIERILGFPQSTIPGSVVASRFSGFRHTMKRLGSGFRGCLPEAATSSTDLVTCAPAQQDNLDSVLNWLGRYASPDSSPLGISFNFHVRDMETNTPIPGALIRMDAVAFDEPLLTSAQGTSSGRFAFKPNTRYAAHVSAEGYRSGTSQGAITDTAPPAQPLNFSVIKLVRDAETPLLASAEGIVNEASSGSPLAQVLVSLTRADQAAPEVSVQNSSDGRYTLHRIVPGTYRLTLNKAGYAERSRIVSFAPGATSSLTDILTLQSSPAVPAVPVLIDVQATAPDHIQFRFRDRSANEAHFEVQRKTGSNGIYEMLPQLPVSPGNGLAITFDDAERLPATAYCYRVRAVNAAAGASVYTGEACAATPASSVTGSPMAPSLPYARALAGGGIAFGFRDNADNESGFRLERKFGATSVYISHAQLAAAVGSGLGVSFEDRSVSGGQTYCYRVLARNVLGESGATAEVCAHAGGPGIVAPRIVRVSVSTEGEQAQPSWCCDETPFSADGRFVVFMSNASNLVTGDSNGTHDIFVRDRDTDGDGVFDESGGVTTTLVSRNASGEQGSSASYYPSISADGRFVAFASYASNLVPEDSNGTYDIFVRDRDADGDGVFDEPDGVATTLVSRSSGGGQGSAESHAPSISADGRFVAFVSFASNLVHGDSNGTYDIFVRDRDTDGDGVFDEPGRVTTTLVSRNASGEQGSSNSYTPSISADGRFVAFMSEAPNLVPGDSNGRLDIFVRDRDTDRDGVFDEPIGVATTLISRSSSGEQGNGDSDETSSISSDGRFVAFASAASNLVPGDSNEAYDIFVRDRDTDRDGVFDEPGGVTTTLVSRSSGGELGSSGSGYPSVSADGRFVGFFSVARNLVLGENNGTVAIFVRDRDADGDGVFDEPGGVTTTLVSRNASGEQGSSASHYPSISADGRFVAFWSEASNLVPGDSNAGGDTFVVDRTQVPPD